MDNKGIRNLEKILRARGLLEEDRIFNNLLKNEKLLTISRITLIALLAVGVITLAVAAPGAVRGLQLFLPQKRKRNFKRIKRASYYLRDRGWISTKKTRDGLIIKLTKDGKEKALQWYFQTLHLNRRKWDGKWRIVAFDIPNKLGKKRDALRNFLKHLGFKRLQKSLFVCPFPCYEEIKAILEYLQLDYYTRVMEVNRIDREEDLMTIFNLD